MTGAGSHSPRSINPSREAKTALSLSLFVTGILTLFARGIVTGRPKPCAAEAQQGSGGTPRARS